MAYHSDPDDYYYGATDDEITQTDNDFTSETYDTAVSEGWSSGGGPDRDDDSGASQR